MVGKSLGSGALSAVRGSVSPVGGSAANRLTNRLPNAAQELLGIGDALQKAHLVNMDTGMVLPCQFNPQSFSVSRSVSWHGRHTPFKNSPEMNYRGSHPAKCEMDLFFDTSDTGLDVRAYTNQLLLMTMKGSGGPLTTLPASTPPRIQFAWGKFELFTSVITELNITFVLFLGDGTPVRARVHLGLTQHDEYDNLKPPQNPTSRTDPRKTRIVQMGERLDNIANEEYGHPSYWRVLAEANNLDHVESLKTGQILVIPPLD